MLSNIGVLNERIFPVSGLQSYWRFDENTGTNAADSKGAIAGTLSNAGAWTTGKIKSGLGFNGGYYCNFGANYQYASAQAYTISAWAKIINFTLQCNILGNYGPIITQDSIDLFVLAGGVVIYLSIELNGATNRCRVTAPCTTATTFQHYVASYNGDRNANNCKIWFNGSPKLITVLANTLTATTPLGGNLTINYRNGSAMNNLNVVDEVGLWNRVLTDAEVTALYNLGTGIFY
jgi:hypothetical protein